MRHLALPLLLLALSACDDNRGRPGWTWTRYEAAGIAGHGLAAWDREYSYEVFSCDGAWRWRQSENTVTGTYSTRGDTICTTPEGGEQSCRVFRRRNDEWVLESLAEGDTPRRLYGLQPLADMGACSPTRIASQEVAPLMRGSEFSLPPGAVHDATNRWSLRCDNTYMTYGGYEERPGEYSINEAGDVCMRREAEGCFGVYRSDDGGYFMGPASSEASEQPWTPLQPILIERQTTCAPN